MTHSHFNARNYGQYTHMCVYFPTSTEEHFGYVYKGDFYYEENGKYFSQPLSICKRIGR